jgi:coenzyme F420-0:L-glutamate ligase/coenzyme F420-1:gamma-L-glutamate ligase
MPTRPDTFGTSVTGPLPAASFFVPRGFPQIAPGAPLAQLVLNVLVREGLRLADGDVLILAQKIVSKSEGRYVDLASVTPSQRARKLAVIAGKDPRIVELVLSESSEVMRCQPGVIIVRHRLGFVLANAGIDRSNLPSDRSDHVLLLPRDPDASAAGLREAIAAATGVLPAVLIIDSLGRAWRIGTCGTCIGAAGFATVRDLRGLPDLFGRKLESTIVGTGDELAAAASLLMGQASEGTPLVLARGLAVGGESDARALIRPIGEDLFL